MYNEIIDPKTGKKVSMSTQEGKIILLNYLKVLIKHGLQMGGGRKQDKENTNPNNELEDEMDELPNGMKIGDVLGHMAHGVDVEIESYNETTGIIITKDIENNFFKTTTENFLLQYLVLHVELILIFLLKSTCQYLCKFHRYYFQF